jgi:uncharacterized protein (TIGR02246 family)
MKTIYAVILCVLLLLVSACAQKVNDPADVQAIKKSMEDFTKAFNAGDAGGVSALMTDKTVYADANMPVAVGKDAIRSLLQAFFGQLKIDMSTPVEDVRVAGDLAVARGTWAGKVSPKLQGVASITDSGSWIVALSRQNDQSWKFDSLTANSNQPLPGSTASGADERALYQIERDWAEASMKKDVAALDRILGNEFHANYGTVVGDKKQFLADYKSGRAKVESMIIGEMNAVVFGDTAVVHGLATEKGSMAGKDTSGQERFTDVFVRRDGRWQCVSGFSTKV